MSDVVRTRFAPSPTGHLHIGGARTALFNYLLAHRLGGSFVLRIEDTDQTRNIPGAEHKLLEDLRWLGLNWDEGPEVGGPHGPYYQSQRLGLYEEHARRLLDQGRAYYAFETPEELEAMRQEALRRGERGFRYPRPKRFPSESEAQQARRQGRPVVIRFMMPQRDFVIPDRILGDVRVKAAELSDFVIIKADGWPTYHFAVVVDDAAMQITHVLRGQEHLLNTANHLALQEALGFPTPTYAHLPIVLNPDGSKMSKRDRDEALRAAVRAALDAPEPLDAELLFRWSGFRTRGEFDRWLAGEDKTRVQLSDQGAQRLTRELGVSPPEINVHDFRVSGYLPEVLVNFIALLGWSPGDDRERFTLQELCATFSLERISKTSARFDRDKLLSFNTAALAALEPKRAVAAFRDYLSANPDSPLGRLDDPLLAHLLEINAGSRTFRHIDQKSAPIFQADDELRYDPGAIRKVLLKGQGAGLALLRELRAELGRWESWEPEPLERFLRGHAEQRGLGLGKVAQPLRLAVTGTTISPPIFHTLALLGKQRALGRIDRLLERLAAQAG